MAFDHGIMGRLEKMRDSGGFLARRNCYARRCEHTGPIEDLRVNHLTATKPGAGFRRRLGDGYDGVRIRGGTHERGALIRKWLYDEAFWIPMEASQNEVAAAVTPAEICVKPSLQFRQFNGAAARKAC